MSRVSYLGLSQEEETCGDVGSLLPDLGDRSFRAEGVCKEAT